jgi:hypothetical protein
MEDGPLAASGNHVISAKRRLVAIGRKFLTYAADCGYRPFRGKAAKW